MAAQMMLDAASHIIRNSVAFEAFLFVYLVCATWIQNLNIYKSNLYLIDYDLFLFVVLVLSRRLVWCALQELQNKFTHMFPAGWNSRFWIIGAICIGGAIMVWSVLRVVQNASLFNLLFLFYPLLLYFSLFGFTLQPRVYQERFCPPKKFLQHLNFSVRNHQCNSNHHFYSYNISTSHSQTSDSSQDSHSPQSSPGNKVNNSFDVNFRLLPATPEEVRHEVDVLMSDLTVRLKQLMFNSLLCAYYVGFIPIQFAEYYVYYDKWWSIELCFFIWANSFVILSCHILPPNYCQILYQCTIHLGCWTRCTNQENIPPWSADVKWPYDSVVHWNNECFKGEGLQNVAIPCDSTQECFYLLFNSQLHIHTWLLAMQCIIVAFEIVVLLRVTFWYQILSISVFLVFNYFILHKLLYNRLMFSKLKLPSQ